MITRQFISALILPDSIFCSSIDQRKVCRFITPRPWVLASLLLGALFLYPAVAWGQPFAPRLPQPRTANAPADLTDTGPLQPEFRVASPSANLSPYAAQILGQLTRPRYYGIGNRTPEQLEHFRSTTDWAVSERQFRSGVPTVLTYHMVEGLSQPITFSIEYTSEVSRSDSLVGRSPGVLAREADPKNRIYGEDLESIPHAVLHAQRLIREILKEFDAAGFRPLDDRLTFILVFSKEGNSSYNWPSRTIRILYRKQTPKDLKRVLAHEMFHAMQHSKGYNWASMITHNHLWFDEATADYAAVHWLGGEPEVEHNTASATYFYPSLFFGEFINISAEFQMHEYQGSVFLNHYLKSLPSSTDIPRTFARLFDYVMANSGVALTDIELPGLLDRFSQESGGMSLGEIYADFVLTHCGSESEFLKVSASANELITEVETITEEDPDLQVRMLVPYVFSARVAQVTTQLPADASHQLAVSLATDAEDFFVWGKVATDLRGSGDAVRITADEGSPWLVEVPAGQSLFLIACNIDTEERDSFVSASNGIAIRVRLAEAEDRAIAEIDRLMGEWMAAAQEIQATQRNLATTPGTIDVAVTGALLAESKAQNAEFARRMRLLIRQLKCVPKIETTDAWTSDLEERESNGQFHADEAGEFGLSLDQVVSVSADGPAAIVKRIDRNFHLQAATTEIEIGATAPIASLRGRWTGSFTIKEMPQIEIAAQQPVDPEDPIAVACAAGFARVLALKNRPLTALAVFTPRAGQAGPEEQGVMRLTVEMPDQEEKPEPRDIQYRYLSGTMSGSRSDEESGLTMDAEFHWLSAEEGGGGELRGRWRATQLNSETGQKELIMSGVWQVKLTPEPPANRR